MALKNIKLSSIRLDGGTQARAALDTQTVNEYAEAMKDGATFDPVRVIFDGSDYWLWDGFHRVHAAMAAGRDVIRAEVRTGQQRDAVKLALGANAQLQRTNADKRHAVLMALEDEEWAKLSSRDLGALCRVSHMTVTRIRKELEGPEPAEPEAEPSSSPAPAETAPFVADEDEGEAYELEPTPEPDGGDDLLYRIGVGQTGFKATLAGISDVKRAVKRIAESPMGIRLNVDVANEHLDKLREQLKGACPHEVCPVCDGKGCARGEKPLCAGAGWIPASLAGVAEDVRNGQKLKDRAG